MITFYYRGHPTNGKRFEHGLDVLCSWNCSADELRNIFGPCGKNESIHIVAEFDESHTPPLLKYRSKTYGCFQDMRKGREDFPAFFTDEIDGSVWESEQLDGWGRFGKSPVFAGPGYEENQKVIPILYKRYQP